MLVDPPVAKIIAKLELGGQKAYPSQLLHGSLGDFLQLASFSSVTSGTAAHQPDQRSMLHYLIHSFQHSPPGFQATDPTILSLGYYPVRRVLADWNLYTYLMSRYFKFYEFALHDIENRLHNSDIIDLQRWRRRSMQSQHKLVLLTEFIDYWLQQGRIPVASLGIWYEKTSCMCSHSWHTITAPLNGWCQ